ncbi:MAG: DUF1761 domain-containing protein [Minisyncoccia bacterium]
MDIGINYWAVLVAAVSSMAVGFLWYGLLFKKPWMAMMGYAPEVMSGMKMAANKAYAIQFVASLVMAYVLSHVLVFATSYMNSSGWTSGASSGFWMWLGFVAPVSLGVVLWENKPWKLWYINASHYLVSLIVMGIILSLWK